MRERWSVRGLASWALLLSFASALPLAGIAYYRLLQLRSEAPVWAEVADAGRTLEGSAVCDGIETPAAAARDLTRWSAALGRLAGAPVLARTNGLYGRIVVLTHEVDAARRSTPEAQVGWVLERCTEIASLSHATVERAVALGLDPSTRTGRYEDLAIRDLTAYLALWAVMATVLLIWLRRRIVRPARRLVRVLQRVADGDLAADIPDVDTGEMRELARAVQHAVDQLEKRDQLKAQRIVELREVVRRLVEVVEAPVLVVGADHRIDYANPAAATAFGEPLERFEGAELARLPGGEAVIAAVDEIMREGESHVDRLVSTNPLRREQHLARCAVVRDSRGQPSRVIMVLKGAEGAWWQRLFRPPDEAAGS